MEERVIETSVREYSKKYVCGTVGNMKDNTLNMKERLEPVRYIVEIAKQAMTELGIKPLICSYPWGYQRVKIIFYGVAYT